MERQSPSLPAEWAASLRLTNVAFTGVTLKDEQPPSQWGVPRWSGSYKLGPLFLSCCQGNHYSESPSHGIHPGKCQMQGKDYQSHRQPTHSLFCTLFSRGNLNTSPSPEPHKVTANYAKFVLACFLGSADRNTHTHTHAHTAAQDNFRAVSHGKHLLLPQRCQRSWFFDLIDLVASGMSLKLSKESSMEFLVVEDPLCLINCTVDVVTISFHIYLRQSRS